ncbi:MAG: DUF4011 domain-containing protein [Syntrophorhabdaceae bacterium]
MPDGNQYTANSVDELVTDLFSGRLTIAEALNKLRTRLLDLSSRNRLLNYRHPKGRSLQFIDAPDINLAFDRLIDGKTILIKPVPEPDPSTYEGRRPDAKQIAISLSLDTSYEFTSATSISAKNRKLPFFQTLYYPEELERLLRRIGSEAKSAIEETGTNILYLIFGFLELYENDESEKPMLAPILSMPVSLEKGGIDNENRTYQFSLIHSGEDITENHTLREKLRQDFSLIFHTFDDQDTPEVYFDKIRKSINKKKRWKVRRQLTLGMLSFGKLAIWSDLDVNKWPNILQHELLKTIFEGNNSSANTGFYAEDYQIDTHPKADIPLIFDADSSQHSAIIDVMAGKNMVINGPPGTGKSQTITNIIAAALAEGKKVLFVSEKLAALEVVRRRLNQANLGQFCLELHSHKTQKKRLLDDIQDRLNANFKIPLGLSVKLATLDNHKKRLGRYAELMSSFAGNCLDMTIHDIFWAIERRSQVLGKLADSLNIKIKNCENWTHQRLAAIKSSLEELANFYEAIKSFDTSHAWWGFYPRSLAPGDSSLIVETLEKAYDTSRELHAITENYIKFVGETERLNIGGIYELESKLANLEAVPEKESIALLPRFFKDDDYAGLKSFVLLRKVLESITKARELLKAGYEILKPNHGLDSGVIDAAKIICSNKLSSSFLKAKLSDLISARDNLKTSIDKFESIGIVAQPFLGKSQINEDVLSQLNTHMGMIHDVNIEHVMLDELQLKAETVSNELIGLKLSLRKIETIAKKGNLIFQGSPIDVAQISDASFFETFMTNRLFTVNEVNQAKRIGDFYLSMLPLSDLRNIHDNLTNFIENISKAFDYIQSVAFSLNLPFDGSMSAINFIKTLSVIAKSAPQDLLNCRETCLENPQIPHIVASAEKAIATESQLRTELNIVFYIDALPNLDTLKESLRIFRRGDSWLNPFRKDWRQARKLYRSVAKERKKAKAEYYCAGFSKLISWIEHKRNFVSDPYYVNSLGSLFRGFETETQNIKTLHDWYRASYSELIHFPELANNIDLISFDSSRIEQLAAMSETINSMCSVLSTCNENLSSILLEKMNPASILKSDCLPSYLISLQEFSNDIIEIITFFSDYVKPSVSPNRAIELMEAKLEFADANEDIARLLKGKDNIKDIDGTLFNFSENTGNIIWYEYIKTVESVCITMLTICNILKPIVIGTSTIKDAKNFVEAKVGLDSVISEILLKSAILPVKDWAEYEQQAEALIEDLDLLANIYSCDLSPNSCIEEIIEAFSQETQAHVIFNNIRDHKETWNLIGPSFYEAETDAEGFLEVFEWGKSIINLNLSEKVTAKLKQNSKETLETIKQYLADMKTLSIRLTEELDELKKFGDLDRNEWQRKIRSDWNKAYPEEIERRIKIAYDGAEDVLAWSKYLVSKSECIDKGLTIFIGLLESNKIPYQFLPDAFEFALYRSIGKQIYSNYSEFSTFNTNAYEKTRSDFQKVDKEIIRLTGKIVGHKINSGTQVPEGHTGIRVSDYTEMNLLRKELAKQKRHIPIRQLISRAGRALIELKPCFMMGPLSVAQYLQHGSLEFDLVVMDEASQLKPEEALGAIVRGKQLVVVGDPKQLPPTSFFDRMLKSDDDDAEEEATAAIQGMESILDICQQLFNPIRTLRWHYRSRHHSLIAFSNHYFYKNLIVFPSPYRINPRLGIRYNYIRNGLYQNRQNVPEAVHVVDAIFEHMIQHEDESLGVVTLNQTQRELIEELFDRKLRTIDTPQHYLKFWEEQGWPFFIKNLENVQGDERDVIYISTTFGKAPNTKAIRQNFGPISRPEGWRRLNVLFTRSRKRLELFSSMSAEDIIIDEKTPQGTKTLRNYLDFAKRGVLGTSVLENEGRDPDSDFEVSVAYILKEAGYEVIPQFGVAGFFIDMVVRNPERRGEFLAGIECDGASYHSGLSVRDRDRIRQEILESLGWKDRIWRIWSTDWFYDRRNAVRKLLDFLEWRKALSKAEPEDIYTSPLVEDDIVPKETEDSQENLGLSDLSANDKFVEVGDEVVYCFDERTDSRHKVRITQGKNNPKLRLVNENTELAQALLGLSPGEEAFFQIPGRQKRKIRLLKIQKQL